MFGATLRHAAMAPCYLVRADTARHELAKRARQHERKSVYLSIYLSLYISIHIDDIHTHICVYIYIYICIYTYTYIYIYIFIDLCVCIYIYISCVAAVGHLCRFAKPRRGGETS